MKKIKALTYDSGFGLGSTISLFVNNNNTIIGYSNYYNHKNYAWSFYPPQHKINFNTFMNRILKQLDTCSREPYLRTIEEKFKAINTVEDEITFLPSKEDNSELNQKFTLVYCRKK